MNQDGIGAYKQNRVMTAEPLNLVVMCYNSAIESLHIVRTRMEENEHEEKVLAFNKFLDIVGELISSLNFEKGGDIAKNLHAIYAYAYRRVSEADVSKDMSAIDEIIGIFEELRDAWEEISKPKARPALKHQAQGMAFGTGSMA